MEIKEYPEFRPIEIGDKDILGGLFVSDPPEISEFSFANLYAWRETEKIDISMMDGCAILRHESAKKPAFFSPAGRGDKRDIITKILRDKAGPFMHVPADVCSLFKDEAGFVIKPEPENADYLFKSSDLALLEGGKYDGKRNLIKNFKRSCDKYEYMPLDKTSAAECLAFEEAWCTVKNCDRVDGLANERRAIREMIGRFEALGLMGGAIKIDGRIRAITLAEALNRNTLVMHVLKAEPDIKGLYQAMMNEFLLRYYRKFEYINMEQDLGVPGLRKSKASYHPVRLIEKFTISIIGRNGDSPR